jgi:hypothetical protein
MGLHIPRSLTVMSATQESTIIGLDNRDVQPDASLLGLPNVRWMLGNLYAFYAIQGTYN